MQPRLNGKSAGFPDEMLSVPLGFKARAISLGYGAVGDRRAGAHRVLPCDADALGQSIGKKCSRNWWSTTGSTPECLKLRPSRPILKHAGLAPNQPLQACQASD